MTDPPRRAYDAAMERFGAAGVPDREAEELLDELVASVRCHTTTERIEVLRNELDAKKDWIPPTPGPTLIYVHTDSETRTLVDRIDWAEADRWTSPRELAILGALLRFSLKQLPKDESE